MLLSDAIKSHKGQLYADDPDTRLITVFLGTVAEGDDPDVPHRLEKLGWSRSVVFEVRVQLEFLDKRWVHSLNFMERSPKEAALAGIRFAQHIQPEDTKLLSINVRTMRLGPIGANGAPHNGRGPAFMSWGAESGTSIEELIERIKAS